MLDLSINNITLRHTLKHTKAHIGNGTGSFTGSNNGGADPQERFKKIYGGYYNLARVVELVDTRDLKSLEGDFVPVQVRPRVCTKKNC